MEKWKGKVRLVIELVKELKCGGCKRNRKYTNTNTTLSMWAFHLWERLKVFGLYWLALVGWAPTLWSTCLPLLIKINRLSTPTSNNLFLSCVFSLIKSTSDPPLIISLPFPFFYYLLYNLPVTSSSHQLWHPICFCFCFCFLIFN